MDVTLVRNIGKQKDYRIKLVAAETIEIKVNGESVVNFTVATGTAANIRFFFEETIL